MAEELHDGQFWLPSHFLNDTSDDDNIIFSSSGFGSCSNSEPETSDNDDLLLLPIHSNPPLLLSTTSPQSTLFGCNSNRQGSSLGSPTEPFSCLKAQIKDDDDDNNTLDLLNKAAGEVAKINTRNNKSTGTGFFDCSTKRVSLPPQPHQTHHPHLLSFSPHVIWGPIELPQQQHYKVTKSNNDNNSNNRHLGLPSTEWPPLAGQAQTQPQAQPTTPIFVPPQKEYGGTGVFLPRRVPSPVGPNKKSDRSASKSKNNEVSRRQNSRPAKVKHGEFQLPSEWIY